jgi:hypothetical protein
MYAKKTDYLSGKRVNENRQRVNEKTDKGLMRKQTNG